MNSHERASLCIAIAAKGHTDIRPCLEALSRDIENTVVPITIRIAHDKDFDLESMRHLFSCYTFNSESECNTAPRVITTQCPEMTSILKLWGAVLAEASEQYAAVIDANCPPSPEWLKTVIENINNDSLVFYGSVEPGWGSNNAKIIGYIIEYAQFKSPVQCDNEFPGNNIVFKTRLLEPKEKLINDGFFKTFMIWKLKQEYNETPKYIDNMSVLYFKDFKFLHYMKRRRDHGQCFGASRLKQDNQPPRWACIVFSPFLFLLRTARIFYWIK